MKLLLKKELCFTAAPLSYFFLAFSVMGFIPNYPILVGAFFTCLGIFKTFQAAREGNDVLYTVLLPVKKRDVVRARYLFVALVQMAAFVLCAVVAALRMTVMSGGVYAANTLMNANLFYLGWVLLIFADFQVVFCGGFWKDAYRIGVPFLLFGITAFVMIGLAETIHHMPGLAALNTPWGMPGVQVGFLAGSAAVYGLSTVLSCRRAEARFETIDLNL